MRRKFLPAAAAVLTAVLAAFGLVSAGLAQSGSSAPPAAGVSAGPCIERGRTLEAQRRWGEALAHYEDGLRQFPADGALRQRFDVARLHFDVCRRYGDRSFRQGLARTPPPEGVDLYGEVLLKIHTHYVEAPKWNRLVEYGTRALEVALEEAAFREANRLTAPQATREAFLDELHRTLDPRPIQTRAEACDAVSVAAALARQRLGLPQFAVMMEYACGAVSFLDHYSTYLTSDQLNEVYSQIEGNFVGLGVVLKAQEGNLVILRVIPNSPAKRAGIRDGDRILAVDGKSTSTLSTDQAANLLQGEAGSAAELVVAAPGGTPRQVRVERERVEVPSVEGARIEDRGQGIAYLKLVCFQKTTLRDLDSALWSLHRAGMKALVIDLRENPGGLLDAAVDAADLFLQRGVIVYTRGRNAHENVTHSAHEAGTWRVPLVLIVDQDSASAAEIFAGALHDHRRATLVGRRTYGKGSVQGIFSLAAAGAGVRLTTAKFYSPSGQPYSGVGVEPDIQVHQVARPTGSAPAGSSPPTPPANSDPMLAAALQAAQQRVVQR